MEEKNEKKTIKRKKLLSEVMMLFSAVFNVILYISNVVLYYIAYKYYDAENIHLNIFLIFYFSMTVEIIILVMLSSTLNADASPFHKLFVNKTRFAYALFWVLIVMRYVTLYYIDNDPVTGKIYYAALGVCFVLSEIIYVNILKKLMLIIKDKPDLCENLENEYKIQITDDELNVLKDIKKSIIVIMFFYAASILISNNIYSNFIFFIIYISIVFLFMFIISYKNIRFYHPKLYITYSVFNSLSACVGCTLIWCFVKSYIDIKFFTERSVNELIIIQLLFILPYLIWASMKLKKLQRHNFEEIVSKLKY